MKGLTKIILLSGLFLFLTDIGSMINIVLHSRATVILFAGSNNKVYIFQENGPSFFQSFLPDIGLVDICDIEFHGQTVSFWTAGYTGSNIKIYLFQDEGSILQIIDVVSAVLLTGIIFLILKTVEPLNFDQDSPNHVAVQETVQTSQPHGQLVCG